MKQIVFFKKLHLSPEKIICRLMASFCAFWAWGLVKETAFDQIAYRQNIKAVTILLFIIPIFIAYSGVNIILQKYETDSWLLLAGATVCVAKWITLSSDFMFTLSVTLTYCLFILYFIHKNNLLWQKWDPGKKTVWSTAIIFSLIGGGVIGLITCLRYMTFSSPNFDFGIFVNMFHHMEKSGLPLCTCERDVLMSHFAVHLSPIWYILLPFYIIFPSPLTLQIGQAVIIASGVIPVVLLCRCRKLSGKSTIISAMVYCFYPALTTSCFFDIHENCFLAPLLLWMFYFFEKEKYISMYAFATLTLFVKEDAAVYIFLFALFIILCEKKRRYGFCLAIGALIYFFAAMDIVTKLAYHYTEIYTDTSPNPSIEGPMINRYANLIYDPEKGLFSALKTVFVNPGYLLKQIFVNQEKIGYFLKMLIPVGFIPFFTKNPSRWILIAPILLNLSTNYSYQYNVNYQYHFGVSAFLIYATILNLSDMNTSTRRATVSVALAACCCFYIVSVYSPIQKNIRNWKENREQYLRIEEILETIPKNASVCCSTYLLPHLADRNEVYEIFYHEGEGNADYVIFDARFPLDYKALYIFERQGYVVKEEYENLLLILAKE